MESTNKDLYDTLNAHGHEYIQLYEEPTGTYDYAYMEKVPEDQKPPEPPDLPPARAETTIEPTASGDKTEASDRRHIFQNPICKGKTCFVIVIIVVIVVIVVSVTVGVVCGTTNSCIGYDMPESNTRTTIPNTRTTTEPRGPRFSKCSGNPLMYKGKMCASTTRHDGNHSGRGACGCGRSNPDMPYKWSLTNYTASVNQAYFDATGKTWCGKTCGVCFRLETTGGFVEGLGQPTAAGQRYVFMVVNLCIDDTWCRQATKTDVNIYGYVAHFSLENNDAQIRRLDWDNPEVTFENVDCNSAHDQNIATPSLDIFNNECECGNPSKFSKP